MNLRRKRAAACLLVIDLLEECTEDESGERWWKRGRTREWIKRRNERGMLKLVEELRVEDTAAYKEMLRMNFETFQEILTAIGPEITKHQVVGGHRVISPAARLTLTLRFLATGETFRSLHFQFRMGKSTISYIVREVCQEIYLVLGARYMSTASSCSEWLQISEDFERMWQFPNCIGAIDGKHVVICTPSGGGSFYYNYKGTHSVVLMAVAGPNYECLYAGVGTNGRVSDGGIWNKTLFLKKLEEGSIRVPEDQPLPFGKEPVPHVLVGDDAFALRPFVMKPYPQRNISLEERIYNYRHSRARRLLENLFGIMANRWRVFLTPIQLSPTFVEDLTLAALTLHNFLRPNKVSKQIYSPKGLADEEDISTGEVVPGSWRSSELQMNPLPVPNSGHNASRLAKGVRDIFKDYFCNEGSVPWQWDRC